MTVEVGAEALDADQLFFDQIVEAAALDPTVQQAAAVDPEDKFRLLLAGLLETLFVERMEQNEVIFGGCMNEREFQQAVSQWISAEVYRRAREPSAGSP